MIVKDIVDIAKVTSLINLNIRNNDDAIIKFVYLGVDELYRRLNLSIKVETVLTNPDLALYELRNKDVSLLLSVYKSNGLELRQTDVLNAVDYEYKQINWRSFLLNKPKNEILFAVYKASPSNMNNLDDVIDLPNAMTNPLLTYVGYLGHSTVNKDNGNESDKYHKRFTDLCRELEMQGYRVDISSESIDLIVKGYR